MSEKKNRDSWKYARRYVPEEVDKEELVPEPKQNVVDKYGITTASITRILTSPNESSNTVKILLMGTKVKIIERVGYWTKVKTIFHPNYEGYVLSDHLMEFS